MNFQEFKKTHWIKHYTNQSEDKRFIKLCSSNPQRPKGVHYTMYWVLIEVVFAGCNYIHFTDLINNFLKEMDADKETLSYDDVKDLIFNYRLFDIHDGGYISNEYILEKDEEYYNEGGM